METEPEQQAKQMVALLVRLDITVFKALSGIQIKHSDALLVITVLRERRPHIKTHAQMEHTVKMLEMRGKSNAKAVRLGIIVKEVIEQEIISAQWVIIVQLIRQPQHSIHVQQGIILKKGDRGVCIETIFLIRKLN